MQNAENGKVSRTTITRKEITMETKIEHQIKHVGVGDTHYVGHVKINGKRFDFCLKTFFQKRDACVPDWNKGQLVLQGGRKNIKLIEDERDFFLHMIGFFAEDLHNNPHIAGLKEKTLEKKQSGTCHMNHELREMLSRPKFGCKF